jgi:hypothetical protein
MKRPLTFFLIPVLLLCANVLHGQTPPGVQPDEEFNLFLIAVGIAFLCIVIGAILVGSLIATLSMLALFGLVAAGVLSAGILVGLYRKSIGAGFKTVIAITGCFSGIVIGEIAFYLINRIYHLHLSGIAVLGIGGFSGLVGGMLLGFVLLLMIRVFLNYCRTKLSF